MSSEEQALEVAEIVTIVIMPFVGPAPFIIVDVIDEFTDYEDPFLQDMLHWAKDNVFLDKLGDAAIAMENGEQYEWTGPWADYIV